MAVLLNNLHMSPRHTMTSFLANRKDITYGYINLDKHFDAKNQPKEASRKDKILAATGSIAATGAAMAVLMKRQQLKNPFHIKYGVKEMVQ